jgi:hypothetical protein
MKFRYYALLLLIAGALLGGVMQLDKRLSSPNPTAGQPAVVMEVLDPSLTPYAAEWQTEIARRFPNACGLLLHGDEVVEDEWIAHPMGYAMHVQTLVKKYQAKFPERTIVLLACNVGHFKLNVPGVYYAKSDVWCHPDRATHYEDDIDFRKSLGHMGIVPLPTTIPSTQPSPFDPWSWLPGVPFPLPKIEPASQHAVKPTRWETGPDNVGNIFEFVAD